MEDYFNSDNEYQQDGFRRVWRQYEDWMECIVTLKTPAQKAAAAAKLEAIIRKLPDQSIFCQGREERAEARKDKTARAVATRKRRRDEALQRAGWVRGGGIMHDIITMSYHDVIL